MQRGRSAIALLITLMFVIVITVGIGYGLKQVNDATKLVKQEQTLYQKNIIVEDILSILNNSSLLQTAISDSESFSLLLSQASFVPFEYEDVTILMKIKSARAKFNPAMLNDVTITQVQKFLGNYNINSQYVDVLIDNIRGIREDNSYKTSIFDEHPYLFRDYIASAKHLEIINEYYAKEYNDNSLEKINFDNLFYYTADRNISIDLNYATTEVWELMLGCSHERAEVLNANGGFYTELKDLNLNDDEKKILETSFKTSFFQPIVQIELEITLKGESSKMSFEYDIQNKKGSNFAYEI